LTDIAQEPCKEIIEGTILENLVMSKFMAQPAKLLPKDTKENSA